MLPCMIIHNVVQDNVSSIKLISSVLYQLLHKCLAFSEQDSGPSALITKYALDVKQTGQRGKELQQNKMIGMHLESLEGFFSLLLI